MLKFKVLAENCTRRRHIVSEHGLSILVYADNSLVLFDCGQTDIFAANAKIGGADIAQVDALVLSHGHYDHTGGVPEFCRINSRAPIYVHPDAFHKRYKKVRGKPVAWEGSEIGIPWVHEKEGSLRDRFINVKSPENIRENIKLSGEIPRTVFFEDNPKNFIIRNSDDSLTEDLIIDEQFMAVKGERGIYIFVGCSHPGVINCVRYATELFPGERPIAVIGGMHLENETMDRIQSTIRQFIELGVERVIPLHCTGMLAICEMKRLMGDKCIFLATGDAYTLE